MKADIVFYTGENLDETTPDIIIYTSQTEIDEMRLGRLR